MTSNTAQKVAVWSGPLGLFFFGSSFGPLGAHFLPPPSPQWTAEHIALHYATYANGVRIGAAMMMLGASLLLVFAGAIAVEMKRVPGAAAMAYGQIGTAALASAALLIAVIFWAVAALRPDRPIGDIALLQDISWIFMVMPAGPGFVQLLTIGYVILMDPAPQPALPRWLGYANIWTAILFLPGFLVAFFLTGPFAWNGLLAFWLPAVVFGAWIIAMTVCLLKAAARWRT